MSKSFILSSSGLKNIINEEEEFTFTFGSHEIHMSNIFAEFISPIVSNLHHSDPTINYLHFDCPLNSESSQYDEIINEESISLFKDLSSGASVSINEDQSIKMQMISILIGNEELFQKLNELYPIEFNISNIDNYLQNLQMLIYFSTKVNKTHYVFSNLIDAISSHFYLIDEEIILKFPKTVFYSILTNENLKVESEDSLFDIINKFFNEKNEKEDKTIFYETLYLNNLSDEKFREFLLSIDSNDINKILWDKIRSRFLSEESSQKMNESRYIQLKGQAFPYDGNNSHAFQGIIHYLTNQAGGNVNDKGVVSVTGSSENGSGVLAKYSVDFDRNFFFRSQDLENSWLQFDFKEHKVHPTHYSIMSPSEDNSHSNPYSWVIEGWNGNGEWKILDSRKEVNSLDGKKAFATFDIKPKLNINEFYRYLRIRETGPTTKNRHYLGISALEYFGSMI